MRRLLCCGETMSDKNQEYQIETSADGTLVFAMPVTLDSVSAPNIKRDALRLLANGAGDIRVDLEATTFMDSAGIGLLVTLYRTAKEQGHAVAIVGARGQPLSLIRSVQMDRVIDIESA